MFYLLRVKEVGQIQTKLSKYYKHTSSSIHNIQEGYAQMPEPLEQLLHNLMNHVNLNHVKLT